MKLARILIFFVVSLLVVSGCRLNINKGSVTPESATQSHRQQVGDSSVAIPSQQEGSTVVVESVSLEQPGYIVIRDDLYGQPNVIVGISSLLPAGISENISIELSIGTTEDVTLYGFVYSDDGNGIFRQLEDSQVINSDGEPVQIRFTVTGMEEIQLDIQY